MSDWVIDASVAAKWFFPESHSARSIAILSPRNLLLAPDLILPEFGNVVWKRARRSEISTDEAAEIMADFLRMPLVIVPSSTLMNVALDLALATTRTVYDCTYIALAIDRGCRMLTGDEKLAIALRGGPYAKYVKAIGD